MLNGRDNSTLGDRDLLEDDGTWSVATDRSLDLTLPAWSAVVLIPDTP